MNVKRGKSRKPLIKGILSFFKILYVEMFEIMGLNLLFLVSCLPVVTIPAACTAMSRVTLCMVRQEEYSLRKTFWRTFHQNFGKSLLGGMLLFLGLGASGYGVLFYFRMLEHSVFYLPFLLSFAVAVVLSAAGLFLFPLIATIDLPLRALLKNAVLLPFLYPYKILAALLVLGVLGSVCILLAPHTVPIILLLLFSVSSLIAANAVSAGIQRCEAPKAGE